MMGLPSPVRIHPSSSELTLFYHEGALSKLRVLRGLRRRSGYVDPDKTAQSDAMCQYATLCSAAKLLFNELVGE